jgi:hypothetical protein
VGGGRRRGQWEAAAPLAYALCACQRIRALPRRFGRLALPAARPPAPVRPARRRPKHQAFGLDDKHGGREGVSGGAGGAGRGPPHQEGAPPRAQTRRASGSRGRDRENARPARPPTPIGLGTYLPCQTRSGRPQRRVSMRAWGVWAVRSQRETREECGNVGNAGVAGGRERRPASVPPERAAPSLLPPPFSFLPVPRASFLSPSLCKTPPTRETGQGPSFLCYITPPDQQTRRAGGWEREREGTFGRVPLFLLPSPPPSLSFVFLSLFSLFLVKIRRTVPTTFSSLSHTLSAYCPCRPPYPPWAAWPCPCAAHCCWCAPLPPRPPPPLPPADHIAAAACGAYPWWWYAAG